MNELKMNNEESTWHFCSSGNETCNTMRKHVSLQIPHLPMPETHWGTKRTYDRKLNVFPVMSNEQLRLIHHARLVSTVQDSDHKWWTPKIMPPTQTIQRDINHALNYFFGFNIVNYCKIDGSPPVPDLLVAAHRTGPSTLQGMSCSPFAGPWAHAWVLKTLAWLLPQSGTGCAITLHMDSFMNAPCNIKMCQWVTSCSAIVSVLLNRLTNENGGTWACDKLIVARVQISSANANKNDS